MKGELKDLDFSIKKQFSQEELEEIA